MHLRLAAHTHTPHTVIHRHTTRHTLSQRTTHTAAATYDTPSPHTTQRQHTHTHTTYSELLRMPPPENASEMGSFTRMLRRCVESLTRGVAAPREPVERTRADATGRTSGDGFCGVGIEMEMRGGERLPSTSPSLLTGLALRARRLGATGIPLVLSGR